MPLSKQPILYLAVATILLPVVASATTWHVTSDGLGDAPTIQAAIDSSAVGDSILVGEGVYHESIITAPNRFLIGSWDQTFTETDVDDFTTTIDADSSGPCVTAEFDAGTDTEGILAAFRLVEGVGLMRNGYRRGGGIYAKGLNTIRDCVISENSADYGGGLYIESDYPTLTRMKIVENVAALGGGGAQIVATESGIVNACVIDGNYLDYEVADRASGLLVSGKVCTVLDSHILNNDAFSFFSSRLDGLGIYADCDSMAIIGCYIYDNGDRSVIGSTSRVPKGLSAPSSSGREKSREVDSRGGGVYMDRGLVRGSIIDANGTGGYDGASFGGGLFIGRGVVEDCVISRNSANANEGFGSGGGIYADSLWIRNTIIRRNHGGGSFSGAGGGVRASYLQMENCSVASNWATCSFSINNVYGGGISGGNVTIRNSTISGNTLGLYVQGQGCGISAGGGLVENCIIVNNTAPWDDFDGYPDVGGILGPVVSRYNVFHGNEGFAYQGIVDSTSHLHVDPMIATTDTLAFNLLLHSPAIDRGDPAILDPDGSRSDIGAYGGPGAVMDRPSRVEVAEAIPGYGVLLKWAAVTAPDLLGYAIYRAEEPGIHPGIETLLDLPDGVGTSYVDRTAIPDKTYFYRVSAYDCSAAPCGELCLPPKLGVHVRCRRRSGRGQLPERDN